MNKFSLGTIVLAFGAGTAANAAEIPIKAAPPQAPVVAAPYSWTGFYIGANLGGSWGRATNNDNLAFTSDRGVLLGGIASPTSDLSGVIGGGQLGYNWQFGPTVIGIETDIQASGQRGSSSAVCPAVATGVGCGNSAATFDHTNKLTWFGTTRGRIGTTFDRFLVYVTGGAAYGEVKSDTTVMRQAGVVSFGTSSTRGGWTIGGGVEGALLRNWTWRVEYLYVDLGTVNSSGAIPTRIGFGQGGVASTSTRITDNIVRGALIYRF